MLYICDDGKSRKIGTKFENPLFQDKIPEKMANQITSLELS
jgi:hypothetical protein